MYFQRPLFARERAEGFYRTTAYVLGLIGANIPLLVIDVLLFACPFYWISGLRREAGTCNHNVLSVSHPIRLVLLLPTSAAVVNSLPCGVCACNRRMESDARDSGHHLLNHVLIHGAHRWLLPVRSSYMC
ncbi:MAG: ABC transporter permease [Stigonema ocellatum SAG 48.90 = DSM 106950]|nr:ABC transporter permease [Stigonema ocellatum SAG 48.90 = DSM 106950]